MPTSEENAPPSKSLENAKKNPLSKELIALLKTIEKPKSIGDFLNIRTPSKQLILFLNEAYQKIIKSKKNQKPVLGNNRKANKYKPNLSTIVEESQEKISDDISDNPQKNESTKITTSPENTTNNEMAISQNMSALIVPIDSKKRKSPNTNRINKQAAESNKRSKTNHSKQSP